MNDDHNLTEMYDAQSKVDARFQPQRNESNQLKPKIGNDIVR